jgi:serine/threonine-protein kinase
MTDIPKRCPACAGRYPADFRVCPRDATPLEDAPPDEDPLVGTVLSDSYEILRVIGEGGMGRVYEAAHRRLRNRRFAIKVLHHELARQPEVVSRFQREAEAASVLMHPNVVEVFDINRTPDGRPYIVAELLEGEEFGHYLERLGRLHLGQAIDIVRQICRALSAAHARGVVHRDMKPENVFLVGGAEAPRVKVLDFGISKLGDGQGSLTRTGVVMGTPAYMPPEQARGSHVDHRADIYAVGAILYRTLTGSKPFADLDPVATLTAVVAEEPRRPSTIERSIPPGLELVIQKAMAKDPAERYGSLAEFEAELAANDPRGPVSPSPTPAPLSGAAALESASACEPAVITGTDATVFADGAARAAVPHTSASGLAANARTRLVLLSIAAGSWLLAGLIDAFASTVRMLGDTTALTRSELTLSTAGALALLMTPGAYWTRHLTRRVWPVTPRVVDTSSRLARALLASVSAYAVVALFGRVSATFGHADPAVQTAPGASLFALAAAAVAAAAAWLLAGVRKRG